MIRENVKRLLAELPPHVTLVAVAKGLYKKLKALRFLGVEMNVLPMGMTNSYWVAIDEGGTMVHVGTNVFGKKADR